MSMDAPLNDPRAPIYTLGQVADMLSMRHARLRRIDQFGIVSPVRSDGGQRRYSRDDITVLQQVKELIDQGLTLNGISEVLKLRERVAELEGQLATRSASQSR